MKQNGKAEALANQGIAMHTPPRPHTPHKILRRQRTPLVIFFLRISVSLETPRRSDHFSCKIMRISHSCQGFLPKSPVRGHSVFLGLLPLKTLIFKSPKKTES
jgi:hypothetical protein